MRCVLERGDVFRGAVSQSASLWKDDLGGLVAALTPHRAARLRVYVEVGSQEWILAEPNARLALALADAGAAVRFVEYNGGHDYACWRGGIADGLRYVFGAD